MDKAFAGEYNAGKNNKIINEYCQSCHIHKDFDAAFHMEEVREKYKRRVFRTARECRTCHYLEKKWVHKQVLRKTRRPEDANRGVYRKFEKNFSKKNNNS